MKYYKNIVVMVVLSVGFLEAACYHEMSTKALEIEVEKRSIEGTLPIEMGLELIKRWQENIRP